MSSTAVFQQPAKTAWIAENSGDRLEQNANGWVLKDAEKEIVYDFDAYGKLVKKTFPNNLTERFEYLDGGKLLRVIGDLQRNVNFAWSGDYISSVEMRGAVVGFEYDSLGRLALVRYPDGSTKKYKYERSDFPVALTGIFDENNIRLKTYKYDSLGRAVSSEAPGGVQKYSVDYSSLSAGMVGVLNPLGFTTWARFHSSAGRTELIAMGRPDAFFNGVVSERAMSDSGLITSEKDFRGVSTNYQWDVTRRLPTVVTEAVGWPEERSTVTEWHPQWRKPVSVTEPGRTTNYTYDSGGNRLTQTITDIATGTARTTAWTYHPSGLVATEKVPNGAVTSYQYDGAGNLTSTTNAQGHVDTYTHDAAGNVLTHTAPTGLVTSYTYDARGRMLTANRGGQLTTFTYRPSGQVATATLPHGHSITYTYDSAHPSSTL